MNVVNLTLRRHRETERKVLEMREEMSADEWAALCEYQAEWWCKQLADVEKTQK